MVEFNHLFLLLVISNFKELNESVPLNDLVNLNLILLLLRDFKAPHHPHSGLHYYLSHHSTDFGLRLNFLPLIFVSHLFKHLFSLLLLLPTFHNFLN